MNRRPPRSTLFPYPPLSRSPAAVTDIPRQSIRSRPPYAESTSHGRPCPLNAVRTSLLNFRFTPSSSTSASRSEEHTSELQSRQYLVCRLLLEKKKNR